jgi:hypothetical protein
VEIRIDDLAHPRLTDAQRAALDWAAANPVSLDDEQLVKEAVATTGLDDFGPDDVWPRYRAHVAAIEADTGQNEFNRRTMRTKLLARLTARLRLTDLLKRYPEIRDIEIERPLVVVGMPRSGTTHLVNLLAADTRFRSLPNWELIEPFPAPGGGPDRNGVDPRYTRCAAGYQGFEALLPESTYMHESTPDSIQEDGELQDVDFWGYTLEWHIRSPVWRDFYLALDPFPRYAYLKTILQALTFLRGPRQWVLKSPQHLEQLPALAATFPDATVAVTHRDPVAVLQSAITMLAHVDRLRRHAVEPEGLAAYWLDRVERLLRACVRDRDVIEGIDVPFHEFMADDVAMVERIYATAGIELTDTARAQIDAHLAAHPRNKIHYDLEGDFGLSPAAVRERFGFYFDRFPVQAEA